MRKNAILSNMLAYLECSSGVSGDMLLGALFDAGLSPLKLEKNLKSAIGLNEWKFQIKNVEKGGLPSTQVNVLGGEKPIKSVRKMVDLLIHSGLPRSVKKKSIKALKLLCKSESFVHGIPLEKVHFHELSSQDTLIDLAGVFLGFELMGIKEIYSSFVEASCLAPAASFLSKEHDIPLRFSDLGYETLTPTGAAILGQLVSRYASINEYVYIIRYGYGGGAERG